MKIPIVKTGLMVSVIILVLIVFAGIATAEIILFDCPSNTDRPTTQLGYAHNYFNGNTVTYLLDVANKPGAEIFEYCVYPTPGFTGNTNDLTPIYSGWTIDRPGTKTYFGFDSRSASKMLVDGSTNVQMGKAKYVKGLPFSQYVLLHISDPGECGEESSCWRRASTSPLPVPTPTATATVTPTPTATAVVTPTPTATAVVTPTPTAIPPIPGDTEPPTKPLCPVAIATGPTTIDLNWWASSDNVGVAEYKIYRSTDNTSFYYLTTTTSMSYVDTGLITGVTYYYAIRAFDAAGNPSLPSDTIYTTPRDIRAPVVIVPSDIMAEAASYSGTAVTFSASATDDIDGSILPICNPPSGSTFHLGLTTITCTATDAAGNTGSTIFTVTVVDTTPPIAPSGLTATPVSTSRIDLSWTASYDAVGVSQYLVYRSIDDTNFVAIGTTAGTTFQNIGLKNDTVYYYYVIAYDIAGNPSGHSNTANARTLSPIPTPSPGPISTPGPGPGPDPSPGPTSTPGPTPDTPPIITVPYDIMEEATSAAGAVVTFSASAIDDIDGPVVVTCNPPSGSTFPLGTTTVVCTATDSNSNLGSATFTITVVDTTLPTPPSGLTATAISPSRIDLGWTASYDAVGVRTYWIFRSLDGTSFIPIGSTVGTTFSNTGLLQNTTYYYVVIAFDAATNPSDPSNVASARTLQQPPNPPPTPGPSPTPVDTGTPGPLPTDIPNPCSPVLNTQRGQTVEVSPAPSVGVRFDAVLVCGDTTAVAYYDNQWTALPGNYKPILFYDIVTTSIYSNSITVKVTYSGIPSGIDENSIRLFHYENGNWVDVTTALDTTSNVVTGVVSSLSPFGLGGTGSGGAGGSGGNGGNVMRGSSLDIIGLIILGICLTAISISRLKRFGK